MTADELKEWLSGEDSAGAGWGKDDGSGETVGHDRHVLSVPHNPTIGGKGPLTLYNSGRKIVAILEKNPKKDPSKYEEEDIQHMRKVVAYNKRHLAQEGKAKQDPDSRSAKSLKNWGHDPQKS